VKTKIEVDLAPFTVPNFVRAEEEDTGKERTAIALSELDSLTLESLCNEFRDAVFAKAGKSRPPQQAPVCHKCRDLV
jgi:hypothetical protein